MVNSTSHLMGKRLVNFGRRKSYSKMTHLLIFDRYPDTTTHVEFFFKLQTKQN